jgi:hypothetical protein
MNSPSFVMAAPGLCCHPLLEALPVFKALQQLSQRVRNGRHRLGHDLGRLVGRVALSLKLVNLILEELAGVVDRWINGKVP